MGYYFNIGGFYLSNVTRAMYFFCYINTIGLIPDSVLKTPVYVKNCKAGHSNKY